VVRKWWCFLLSSIFTFFAGLTIVLLWRAFAFLFCRKEPEFSPNDPKQKEQKAARQGKQEFEGTFMTEAKDWAGELISGQTTTGRILVSLINSDTCLARSMLIKGSLRRRSHFSNING
jgi:potassium large conductance calcium-activated channel subfamily M alpha protein 1